MEEILFRGKSKGKPEWVYGSLYKEGSQAFILVGGRFYPEPSNGQSALGIMDWYEVIPETVGQFTGLTDKSGDKIFEGDIVLIEGHSIGVIRYLSDEALFAVDFPSHSLSLNDTTSKYIEIIGNIHDNPELLP